MYPTLQPRAGLDNGIMSGARGDRAEGVRVTQGWLWLQQQGGQGWLRQVEQDAQARLWSCAIDAAAIPHRAMHPAAVGVQGRC